MISLSDATRRHDLESEWDCIVIGAGPAGSMAARRAAQRGLRTLIVERKRFPREKVCGACVNRRAMMVLERVGLGDTLRVCQGMPIDRVRIQCRGRQVQLPLPVGMAVSRALLDESLLQAAVDAGATCLQSTTARVLPIEPCMSDGFPATSGSQFRPVKLASSRPGSADEDARTVLGKVVIAADGLGHPSLQQISEFHDRVADTSRVGIGTVVDGCADLVPAGTIGMAVGRGGYVGLVRVLGDRLNVAACVDANVLRELGGPGMAVADILQQVGFPDFGAAEQQWAGTVPLTRTANTVAKRRVLVVGDAAGYVEPFTGEGIAFALAGGIAAGDCAVGAVRHSHLAAEALWKQEWSRLVLQRQKWCRRLARLLRHPSALPLAVRAAAAFPALAQRIITTLNDPVLESEVSFS